MSIEAMMWAKRQRAGGPGPKVVLLVLADYADESWTCWPSQARIADETELTERSVRRCTARLVEAGLVRVEKRWAAANQTLNRYVLLHAPEPGDNRMRQPGETKLPPDTVSTRPDTVSVRTGHHVRRSFIEQSGTLGGQNVRSDPGQPAALDAMIARRACPHCHGSTWVTGDDGAGVIRCQCYEELEA